MIRKVVSCSAVAALLLSGSHLQASVRVTGCVTTPLELNGASIAAMPQHPRTVKVFGPQGDYRCSVDVTGASLREILEKAVVSKATDDGFGRTIDTYVMVKGSAGERALFSYGEIFMTGDPAMFLLVDRMRLRISGHHESLAGTGWEPSPWLDAPGREKPRFDGCAGCHDGTNQLKLSMPNGICLVPTRDRVGRRFIRDVTEVMVCQSGVKVAGARPKGEEMWVDRANLILPDNRSVTIGEDATSEASPVEWQDATVGMGRGYHGDHTWSGVSVRSLLERAMGSAPDYGTLAVLVTASDGYRSLYSGGEIAYSPLGETLMLASTEDAKPLARDSGRFRTVVKGDFFVDRSVRSVQDIRVIVAPATCEAAGQSEKH
ncbi:MAG: hypothetical protein AB1714_03300 [Acidobacteriota bacterium]